MAASIPPLPPTNEYIEEKIKNGAQTIAEIDPNFAKWILSGPLGIFHKLFKTDTYKMLYKPLWRK